MVLKWTIDDHLTLGNLKSIAFCILRRGDVLIFVPGAYESHGL